MGVDLVKVDLVCANCIVMLTNICGHILITLYIT